MHGICCKWQLFRVGQGRMWKKEDEYSDYVDNGGRRSAWRCG